MAFLRDILHAAIEARAMQKRIDAMSARYKAGLASYGKKVKTEKRKARIVAELNAMGVKPRIRRKAITHRVILRDSLQLAWKRRSYFSLILVALFLSSSRVEARHGDYTEVATDRRSWLDCLKCGYRSNAIRYRIVPNPCEEGAEALFYPSLIWPALPAKESVRWDNAERH